MNLGARLSEIWIATADKVGIPVARGGDSYVHYDGAVLHIADDEHLDADDTVAQLVLHELCHALVEGPAAMGVSDWGLDNTSNRDDVREAAAVRLQAHLLGAYGLRGVLFPTTVVRPFFESLGRDALAPGTDESARLARKAVVLAARFPMREALREALEASVVAVGRGLHPKTGFPLALDGARCGDCAERSPGGLCRQASARQRVYVRKADEACTRFVGPLDCLACGACCRSAYDRVPVLPTDVVVTRHPSLLVLLESGLSLRRRDDRCAALGGPDGGPYACAIYDDRPRTCRHFERGGNNCLDARRRVGLAV